MYSRLWIISVAALSALLIDQVSANQCYQKNSASSLCPEGWIGQGTYCYKFVNRPRLTRIQAAQSCRSMYGTLVRVADLKQHGFFNGWLEANAVNKSVQWYTSGVMSPKSFGQYVWDGHGKNLLDFNTELNKLWKIKTPRPDQETVWPKDKKNIVYGTDGRTYGFYLVTGDKQLPYICEIKKSDVQKAGLLIRTSTYGVQNLSYVPRAPCFTVEPKDYLYFMKDTSASIGSFEKRIAPGENIAFFTCAAVGTPRPTYNWYIVHTTVRPANRTMINPLNTKYGGRFSITDGRLVINFPKVTDPNGEERYQCEAKNIHGTVLSNEAALTFGQMARFSNTGRSPKRVNIYKMAALSCDPPAKMKPVKQMVFTFLKVEKRSGGEKSFVPILSTTRPMVFASQDGALYFSAVTQEDNGTYVCTVTMRDSSGGSSQKSPEMDLIVVKGVTNVQRINIHTGFPAMFPKDAFRGETLRLECFADGNAHSTITYGWKKIGGQISGRARYENLNRVIIIENSQAEDEGEYECTASQIPTSDDPGGKSSAKVKVELNAKPYFITPLKNQYVDKDSDVKLLCEASGKPAVRYVWYRGSTRLQNRGKITITTKSDSSELKITKIQLEEAGSYGCEVINTYGAAYSYAWIKVLSFKPNFNKYPLENMEGMISQQLIYKCRAEGAPTPTKKWYVNGTILSTQEVSVDPVTGGVKCASSHCVYRDGNLMITKLAASNAGVYTCEAKNALGSARSAAQLQVMPAPIWTLEPENRQILVNTTVDIPCLAQSAAHLDINYAWYFESHRLRFDRLNLDARRYDKAQLLRPYGRNFGSLRIENVQFENEGLYVCELETPIGKLSKKAWIRVAGPPGQSAGVTVTTGNTSNVEVAWTRGSPHHSKIKYYIIEAATARSPDTWVKFKQVNEPKGPITENYKDRRRTVVHGLAANTTYYIRIVAANDLGIGEPSPKSNEFTTKAMPPVKVPQNVTGGGGKRSTLVVRWNAIDSAFYNGPNFKYMINHKEPTNREWLINDLDPPKAKFSDLEKRFIVYTITLPEGTGDYKEYDVRVGSVNKEGAGPFSKPVRIRSAEAVPTSTPNDVVAAAYNSTALLVRWNRPKPNKGEGMIQGYRIVYWPRKKKCASNNRDRVALGIRQTVFGNVDKGIIIGLAIDQYYCIVVQVFNQAGDGPESGVAEQTTYKTAPTTYPTLVKLKPTGRPNEIEVNWIGIYTLPQEESLDGYKIRYWLTGAPSNVYKDVDVGLKTNGYLERLGPNMRYNVRVYGYSRGGVGAMSSPTIQFMLQPAAECTPGYWDGPDMRYEFFCSSCRIKTSALFTIICVITSFFLRQLHSGNV